VPFVATNASAVFNYYCRVLSRGMTATRVSRRPEFQDI
jgi:hypothetical protein